MALNYAKTNTFVTGTTIASSAVNANFDDVVNTFTGLENMSKSLTNLVVDSTLRSLGTVQSADGTVANCGYIFTAEANTGFYRIGTGNIGVATAGVKRFDISTTAITSALPLAMGANKITGLANATVSTDAVALNQISTTNLLCSTTNDAAAAGYIGERISSTVLFASRASTGSSTQFGAVTSISLTAGDWDVSGIASTALNGATATVFDIFLSAFSGSTTTDLSQGDNTFEGPPPTTAADATLTVPGYRVSIASTTTYYIKVAVTFSAGTPKMYGRISARRTR